MILSGGLEQKTGRKKFAAHFMNFVREELVEKWKPFDGHLNVDSFVMLNICDWELLWDCFAVTVNMNPDLFGIISFEIYLICMNELVLVSI